MLEYYTSIIDSESAKKDVSDRMSFQHLANSHFYYLISHHFRNAIWRKK